MTGRGRDNSVDNDISLRFRQGVRLCIPPGITSVSFEEARHLTRNQRKRMRALGIDVPYMPSGGQGGRGKSRERQYKEDRTWRAFNVEAEGNRLADNAESASDALLRLLRQHHPELINSYPSRNP